MTNVAAYAKAIVAVVVGALATWLAGKGFNLDIAAQTAIVGVVTGIVVYLVPNKKPAA